jgi:hypothetical protein
MSERTGLGIVEIAILEAVETRGTDRVAGTRPRPALIRRLHRHLLLDRVGPLHHGRRNQLSARTDVIAAIERKRSFRNGRGLSGQLASHHLVV